jgi:hypothetical protein
MRSAASAMLTNRREMRREVRAPSSNAHSTTLPPTPAAIQLSWRTAASLNAVEKLR